MSHLSSISCLALTLLFLLSEVPVKSCDIATETGYDFEYIGDELEVFWTTPDSQAETVTFMVRSATEAWVSLAFSEDDLMIGADAVVGLPDNSTVVEYDLDSKNILEITLSADNDISNYSIEQADGATTLIFTRNTSPTGEGKLAIPTVAGESIYLLWAVGSENAWGYHAERGVNLLDLFCVSTPAPADSTTMSPTAVNETGGTDSGATQLLSGGAWKASAAMVVAAMTAGLGAFWVL